MDDLELLQEYAAAGSQAAFARIVARHIDMVYSVSLRHLRNAAEAEDATQSVFISLARKAGSLQRGTVVAGWLYRAARFEAAKSARQASTRRRHEMAAAGLKPEMTSPAQDASATDASDAVDCALDRLRSADRHAIVLRYFEGRDFDGVAREMGTSEDAARKRVSRALEKLRGILQRSDGGAVAGVALSTLGVEKLLMASIAKAPAALTASTLSAVASLPVAAGAAAGAAFAKGALLTMALSKAKLAVVGAVALLLIGSGGVVAYKALRPAREQVVAINNWPNTSTPSDGQGWRVKFNEAYGLKPGEVLRQVAIPPLAERQAWWESEQRRQGGGNFKLQDDQRFTMEWDGASARWNSLSFSEASVSSVLQMAIRLKIWEMDHPSIPIALPLPGDWVVRKGASNQAKMDAIAAVISAKIGRTIHFQKRSIPRDTLIARGTYHFSPPDGDANIKTVEFIGEPFVEQQKPQSINSSLSDLFSRLENAARTRVFDETGAGDTRISIRDHMDIRNVSVLLSNLTKQTGLEFVHEMRPVDTWCMVDDAGQITSIVPPDFLREYALREGEYARRILPPFGAERDAFWDITGAEHRDAPRPGPSTTLLLEWNGVTINYHAASECCLLETLLSMGLNMDWREFDESVPMKTVMHGDIVIRNSGTPQQRLDGVAALLSDELHRPVHFERRNVPCDVVVVTGDAKDRPAGTTPVLFADAGPAKPRSPVFDTPARDFFKNNLPWLLHLRVVDQTTNPSLLIHWQSAFSGPILVDPAIHDLTEQSGFTYSREKRDMPIWTLVDGPPPATQPNSVTH